jgi:hypothetical protein
MVPDSWRTRTRSGADIETGPERQATLVLARTSATAVEPDLSQDDRAYRSFLRPYAFNFAYSRGIGRDPQVFLTPVDMGRDHGQSG